MKKGQGLSMNVIIIAAIALVVLVVLVLLVFRGGASTNQGTNCAAFEGQCYQIGTGQSCQTVSQGAYPIRAGHACSTEGQVCCLPNKLGI